MKNSSIVDELNETPETFNDRSIPIEIDKTTVTITKDKVTTTVSSKKPGLTKRLFKKAKVMIDEYILNLISDSAMVKVLNSRIDEVNTITYMIESNSSANTQAIMENTNKILSMDNTFSKRHIDLQKKIQRLR